MPTPTIVPVIIASNPSVGAASLGPSLWMLCSMLLLIPFLAVTFFFVDRAYASYNYKRADRVLTISAITYTLLVFTLIPFFAGMGSSEKEPEKETQIIGYRDGVKFVCEKDRWANTYCKPMKEEPESE